MLQKSGGFSRFDPADGRADCREDGQAGQSHCPHGLQVGLQTPDWWLDLVKSSLVPGLDNVAIVVRSLFVMYGPAARKFRGGKLDRHAHRRRSTAVPIPAPHDSERTCRPEWPSPNGWW